MRRIRNIGIARSALGKDPHLTSAAEAALSRSGRGVKATLWLITVLLIVACCGRSALAQNSIGIIPGIGQPGLAGYLGPGNQVCINGICPATAFGAVGDDVHDDTAALQAGLNAAVLSGSELFLSAGKYKTTAPLVHATSVDNAPGLKLRGAGELTTKIDPQFTGAQTTLTSQLKVGDTTVNVASIAGFVQLPGTSFYATTGGCQPGSCGYMIDVGSEQLYCTTATGGGSSSFSGCARGYDGVPPQNFANGTAVKQEAFALVVDGSAAYHGQTGSPFQFGGYIKDLTIGGHAGYTPLSGGPVGGISLTAAWYVALDHVDIEHVTGDCLREPARPDLTNINPDYYGTQVIRITHPNFQNCGGWGIRDDDFTDGSVNVDSGIIDNNALGGILAASGFTWVTNSAVATNGTSGDPNTGGILLTGVGSGGVQRFHLESLECDSNYGYCLWAQKGQNIHIRNVRDNISTFWGATQRPLISQIYGMPGTLWLKTNGYNSGDQLIETNNNTLHLWQTTGACASGSSLPAWTPGGNVSDGTCTWADQGALSAGSYPFYNASQVGEVDNVGSIFRQSPAHQTGPNAFGFYSTTSGDGVNYPQGVSTNWQKTFSFRDWYLYSNTDLLNLFMGVDANVKSNLVAELNGARGINGVVNGTLGLANGGASGATVTLQNPSASSAYNWNYPATAGSSGQVLASGGGGNAPMTWSSALVLTGGPSWAKFYGTGAEGAGPSSGSIAVGEHWFSGWICNGNITLNTNGALIVRSQGAVILNPNCVINSNGAHESVGGNLGGAGGSGGSGAANSAAGIASALYNVTNGAVSAPYTLSARAAASAAGTGNDGGVISSALEQSVESAGPPAIPGGGGVGTAGGSSGGAAGNGGPAIVIIAPSIQVGSGTIIDASGGPGAAAAANSTGAGGGGGGGTIWLITANGGFTDNGGIYKYGGGPGGAITQPSIQAVGGGCDTTGCGTDAAFTVTGLTSGGLDASKITIANAGSGYKTAPVCQVNAGTSGLTGSPACHFTISGGAIASVVIDTAGSGGTLTTYTTAFIGGYGANGWYWQAGF
jgi:hypothetical protein